MEIIFNPEFQRWEVYSPDAVIRAGVPQPDFVSVSYWKCETYRRAVNGKA